MITRFIQNLTILFCLCLLSYPYGNIALAQKKNVIDAPTEAIILKIKGFVTQDKQKLSDALATLICNNNKIKTVTTGKDGIFNLNLDLQKEYTIIVSKRGLVSQKIKVSTIVPANKIGETWWQCKVNINLFEAIDGLNVSALDEPVTQISFDNIDDFKQDEVYAKSMKSKIEEIAGKIGDLKKETANKKLKEGDKLFAQKKFEEAWLCYNKAKALSPKDEKAGEKVLKVRKQIKANDDDGYKKAIETANKFIKSKDKSNAQTWFEIALLFKDNDQTALAKLEEINNGGKIEVTADNNGDTEVVADKKLDKNEEENIVKRIDGFKKQIKVFEKEKNIRSLASILDSIGNLYVKQNVKEEAVKFFEDAVKAKEEIGEIKDVAKILGKEAKLYYEMGQYDNSLLAYEKALKVNEELKNKDEVASILGNLANLYNYTYRTDDALHAYEKLIAVKADQGDKQGTSDAYTNIGDIYLAKQNTDKAIDNYNKSLKMDIELKDQKGQATNYNNLGVAYHKKGEYKKSLESHDKAQNLYENLGDKKGLAKTYNNLGNNYYKMKEISKANENYEKAMKLMVEQKDEKGELIALFNLGNLFKEQKDFKKALEKYNKSIDIAKRINYQDALGKNYKAVSGIYYEQKDYQKAYDSYKLSINTKYIEEEDEQLSEMQTKISNNLQIENLKNKLSEQAYVYQLKDEQAKKDIALKNLVIEKQDAENKKQRILIFAFVIGFLVVVIFLILIFRQYKQIKKANQLLAQKNEEIMQQKEEITAQRDQLETINIELEKLSIVARETDNAVMIMDGKGNFEWVNAGFIRLFGITLEQLISERGSNFIETSASEDAKDLFIACIENKITVNYDTFTFNAKGEKIWTQTTLTPITSIDGEVIKLVAIDSNITQIKLAEEEIKQQNEEIKAQSEQLQKTYKELETKNLQIIDSINYARRIQDAILPRHSLMKQVIPQSFILFKPKAIVSGDFYWFSQQGDKTFIAAVDCTGHGVPGAFMSMIGNTLMNEIVINKEIHTPSSILLELNKGISFSLTQGKEGEDTQDDGMDISICCIENSKKQITLALAGHTAYVVKNNQIEPLEGDVYSIGGMFAMKPGITYTDHTINITEPLSVYMCSDGYQDQFGGADNKKFMASKMSKLFLEIHKEEMCVQHDILDEKIEEWKGSRKQLDDILVVGLRFDPAEMK